MVIHAGEDAHGGVVFCADLIRGAHGYTCRSPWADRNAELIDERQFLEDKLARNVRLFFTHDPQVALAQLGRDDKGRFVTLHEQGELKARALELTAEPSVGLGSHPRYDAFRQLLMRASPASFFAPASALHLRMRSCCGLTALVSAAWPLRQELCAVLAGITLQPLFLAEHSAMRCCCGVVALATRGQPAGQRPAGSGFHRNAQAVAGARAFASDR